MKEDIFELEGLDLPAGNMNSLGKEYDIKGEDADLFDEFDQMLKDLGKDEALEESKETVPQKKEAITDQKENIEMEAESKMAENTESNIDELMSDDILDLLDSISPLEEGEEHTEEGEGSSDQESKEGPIEDKEPADVASDGNNKENEEPISKKEKGKKEKVKKEKKERKNGLLSKVFGNVKKERSEEEIAKIKEKIIADAQEKEDAEIRKKQKDASAKEAKKKKAADKKAKAAKQKQEAAKRKQEAAKKKAEEAKKRKDEKERKKQELQNLIDEVDNDEGRINRIGATIIFLFFAIIAVYILVGTKLYSYDTNISNAKKDFGNKHYNEAYEDVAGLKIRKADKDFYQQVVTVMFTYKQLNSFNNYYAAGLYPEALDSLLKGLTRYDKYFEDAVALGIEEDMNFVRKEIIGNLKEVFALSEEEAVLIAAMDDQQEYSKLVYEIAGKLEPPVRQSKQEEEEQK